MVFQYSLKMTWVIVGALLLIGDSFFYQYFLGTNFGVYCFLLVLLTFPFFQLKKKQNREWLLLLLLSLSLVFDLTWLNGSFFLITFIFLLYSREVENISYSVFSVFKTVIFFMFKSMATIPLDFKCTVDLLIDSRANLPLMIKRSFYWLIAVGFSSVFLFLFYLANPFLQNQLEMLFDGLIEALIAFFELNLFVRIFIWGLLFVCSWSVLRTRKAPEYFFDYDEKPERLPLDLVIKCLLCFNFVFAIQSISDLYFLLGNGELPIGISYAQYAQRGAYPLIAVTLLSGALICLVFKEGFESQKSSIARKLVYFWLFQNILLVFFTFERLSLYVSIFHLTRWRYATFIWLLLITLGFALTFYRIRFQKSNSWFLRQNMLITVWVLLACCFIKSDVVISYYNITHCKEYTGQGNTLDVVYLESLGVSSLPAIAFGKNNNAEAMVEFEKSRIKILESYQLSQKNWRESSIFEILLIKILSRPK